MALPTTTQLLTQKRAVAPYFVTARVVACLPEVGLVYVETREGLRHVLTPKTACEAIEALQVGQFVDCHISAGLPRVLAATAVSGTF